MIQSRYQLRGYPNFLSADTQRPWRLREGEPVSDRGSLGKEIYSPLAFENAAGSNYFARSR